MSQHPAFSDRTAWETAETELAMALRMRGETGLPIFDLTASNPTDNGFLYDEAATLAPLSFKDGLRYEPDARGILPAREAVCGYYRDHGASVGAEHVLLTTSTSEAYSFLFRLLCNPGDEVLIAQPSYPLFDFLASLDDVKLVPYALFYDHGWHLDIEAVRERITPRTRALSLVHPNNPTGHAVKPDERRRLEALCREHGLALIVDEVFLDYPLAQNAVTSFAVGPHPVLTFVLSGLSKIAALPQMKAAWVAALGPEPVLQQALARLEVIGDTFLSVNSPVQWALPQWLARREGMQRQIRARTQDNLQHLDKLLGTQTMVTRLEAEAGWYAVLRIPALRPDEETAMELVRDAGVSVHPGYFFGFPESGWLVVSLLAREEEFGRGVEVILDAFRE